LSLLQDFDRIVLDEALLGVARMKCDWTGEKKKYSDLTFSQNFEEKNYSSTSPI
jgi:hypothetical protein